MRVGPRVTVSVSVPVFVSVALPMAVPARRRLGRSDCFRRRRVGSGIETPEAPAAGSVMGMMTVVAVVRLRASAVRAVGSTSAHRGVERFERESLGCSSIAFHTGATARVVPAKTPRDRTRARLTRETRAPRAP